MTDEPTTPGPVATTPWTPPPTSDPPKPSGRRRLGCFVLFVAMLVFAGYVGLRFLGNQVATILGGTAEFGTGGTGCSVTGRAASFPRSTGPVHAVAHLKHEVQAGTTVTLTIEQNGEPFETADQAFPETGACVYTTIEVGQLEPATYGLILSTGGEELSRGSFEVTP
jgi:hypothetical protein